MKWRSTLTCFSVSSKPSVTQATVRSVTVRAFSVLITRSGLCRTLVHIWIKTNILNALCSIVALYQTSCSGTSANESSRPHTTFLQRPPPFVSQLVLPKVAVEKKSTYTCVCQYILENTEHTREAYAANQTNSTRNKTKNNNKKK